MFINNMFLPTDLKPYVLFCAFGFSVFCSETCVIFDIMPLDRVYGGHTKRLFAWPTPFEESSPSRPLFYPQQVCFKYGVCPEHPHRSSRLRFAPNLWIHGVAPSVCIAPEFLNTLPVTTGASACVHFQCMSRVCARCRVHSGWVQYSVTASLHICTMQVANRFWQSSRKTVIACS